MVVFNSIKVESISENEFKITQEYFSEIPEKPDDFDTVQRLRESGLIEENPEKVNERYWKQVEWMPFSNEFYEAITKSANSPYMPWWCVGIYDSQLIGRVENIESSENDTVFVQRFWARTIPGMPATIGLKLTPSYPSSKELIGNRRFGTEDMVISQHPDITRQYIEMKVLRVCSDSSHCEETDTFTLGRTLPTLNYDYVKEIWFEVTVDRNIPKGWYVANLNAIAPDRKFTSDRIYEHLDKDESYLDPNFGQSCGIPSFSFFVEVR